MLKAALSIGGHQGTPTHFHLSLWVCEYAPCSEVTLLSMDAPLTLGAYLLTISNDFGPFSCQQEKAYPLF